MTVGATDPNVQAVAGDTGMVVLTQSIFKPIVTSSCKGTTCGEYKVVQQVFRSLLVCTVGVHYSRRRTGLIPPVQVSKHLRCIFPVGFQFAQV